MTVSVYQHDEVWTADEKRLGVARSLFERPEAEVNPAELLFSKYLMVESFELGDDYFVPLDYVDTREQDGRVFLAASMKEVLRQTWSRAPEFIAQGRGARLPLQPAPAAEGGSA